MLKIGAEAWRTMIEHARAAAPEEACGILVGQEQADGRHVLRAVACRNASVGDRRNHFLIDPEQQTATQREAREAGLEIVGYYHSHHNGSAEPSEEDRRQAHPCVSHVILAFRGGAFVEARSWRMDKDGVPVEEQAEAEVVTGTPQAASGKADGC